MASRTHSLTLTASRLLAASLLAAAIISALRRRRMRTVKRTSAAPLSARDRDMPNSKDCTAEARKVLPYFTSTQLDATGPGGT